jgi:hypothetical protein
MLANGRRRRVRCHWCGIKMACNCWLDDRKTHIILCPKCQVAELAILVFGRDSQSSEATEPVKPPQNQAPR